MEGTIITTFLIVFREALEASLIVGIIMTILVRMEQRRFFPHVYGSVLLAIGASFLIGMTLTHFTESTKEEFEKIIEGSISFIACCVLTYMIFWMDTQAKKIRPQIETKLEQAISQKEYWTLISLPFLAILREGAETVLFLKAVAMKNSGYISLWGGIVGFLLAVFIVGLIFILGKRVPLKPFFQSTSLFLLLVAAGLLAYGIHEFQEIGLIPEGYAPVWNINHILNEKQGIGAFLKSMFGYNGNPSLIEVIGYSLYILGIYIALRKRQPKLSTAN